MAKDRGNTELRWKTRKGEWNCEREPISLYENVLCWLTGNHDSGIGDWCKQMVAARSGHFMISHTRPKDRYWSELQNSFYIRTRLSNWLMSVILNDACSITYHQGRSLKFGTDLIVEMPRMQPHLFGAADTQNTLKHATRYRWRLEQGSWKYEEAPDLLYEEVLLWLAGKHDRGVEDWCNRMEANRDIWFGAYIPDLKSGRISRA